ncbi:MAG TPA: hypothetical protein VFZ25_07390, partial [Chloroflexota bacterium]|nr:hypothetical protein [Chloroflexota bacterium]
VALVVVVAWASHQARAPAAQVATATPAAPGTNQAVMLGPATPGNATSQVVVPLGDTRGATISLNAGTGDLRVGALPADNANLARADADLSDGEQLIKKSSTVDGKTELTLNAEGSTGFFWPFGRQQHHEDSLAVSLTPKVPLTLQTNLGAGNSELDLTNLSVQTLDVNRGGGGETIVHLPSGAGTTRANVRIGAGDLTLVVPPDVGAYLHTSKGLVSVDLPAGRFTTVSDGYQSANYATAANQVDVYLQMGVGHVDVQ